MNAPRYYVLRTETVLLNSYYMNFTTKVLNEMPHSIFSPYNRYLLITLLILLLLLRLNSDRTLAYSTISYHLRPSCTCSAHFTSCIFFRSFLTSSSQRDSSHPAGLPVSGFHLCILFTMLVSDILFLYHMFIGPCIIVIVEE